MGTLRGRALAGAALLLALFGVGTLVALHLLPEFGGVDPVAAMLSDYARTPAGPLFTAAVLAVGAASALLGAAMRARGLLRGWPAHAALVLWCASLVGVATCVKDPPHAPLTAEGTAHLWATSLTCVSLPLLGGLLWLRFRAHPRWRGRAVASGAVAAAGVACMVPFVVGYLVRGGPVEERFTGLATGLIERGMVGVDAAAMLVFALWTLAASGHRGWSWSTWRSPERTSRLQSRPETPDTVPRSIDGHVRPARSGLRLLRARAAHQRRDQRAAPQQAPRHVRQRCQHNPGEA